MALAQQEFEFTDDSIQTRGEGADYSHRITTSPPGFENLTASLIYTQFEAAGLKAI